MKTRFAITVWLLLSIPVVAPAQLSQDRPLYVGGIGKFIGGLGVHAEFPVQDKLTLRGEVGWLFFILDINAGLGYSITPQIEVYTTLHATIMSFFSSTIAYGPEFGIDLRVTRVFHIEGGVVYLKNESAQEWLPNVGITLNIPLSQ